MPPNQRQGRPCDSCLAPRSQVRRLPPDRSARGKPRAPVQPQRSRLDRSLSWIVESALKNRHSQFVIDGEAVILGVDGIADFDALHSRQHEEEVQLYAFDVLALDGDDLRRLPLSMRKTNLAQLLRGRWLNGRLSERPRLSWLWAGLASEARRRARWLPSPARSRPTRRVFHRQRLGFTKQMDPLQAPGKIAGAA
jgi:hypothetical protein